MHDILNGKITVILFLSHVHFFWLCLFGKVILILIQISIHVFKNKLETCFHVSRDVKQ